MTAPRWLRRAAVVTLALTALAATAAAGTSIATASGTGCPPATTCLPGLIITDHAPGMSAPFLIEDNEGRSPGHNAPMFWVDGFQAGSVNPVCAAATVPYLAHEACLGGPPFNATGGHPVLALCARVALVRVSPPMYDCVQWEVLTAARLRRLIALDDAMRAAGITPRDLRMLARWLHATGR